MKLLISMLLLLCSCMNAYAFNSYYPPERISCKLNRHNSLICHEFDRSYLTEMTSNADLTRNTHTTFPFFSAVAYLEGPHNAKVYYTYQGHSLQTVMLTTTTNTIMPDFNNGHWERVGNGKYICVASYMSCSITNLPIKA